MKVKCISCKGIGGNLPITIGKIYDVIKTENIPFSPHRFDDPSGPYFLIKCDNKQEKHIEATRFRELTIDEKRELKLKELGI